MKTLRQFTLFILMFMTVTIVKGQDQKVTSNGLDIHYRVFGQGTPIVILGGGPGDVADRYLDLCQLLAKHFQCILVEQRGTGLSTPKVIDATTINVTLTLKDFEAIRQQLGLKQWVVLGFSYGGYLASLYAHFYPASVSSLLLLDSMGLNWEGSSQFEDNVTSRLWAAELERCDYWKDSERMKTNPQHAITEIIRARMPGYFFDHKKALSVSQAIKDTDFNFEMGEFIYRDTIEQKLDLLQLKLSFTGPVLILHGRQDPTGESVPLYLKNYYTNSQLVFVEKCGHYSWIEQPEKVMTAITKFLDAQAPS